MVVLVVLVRVELDRNPWEKMEKYEFNSNGVHYGSLFRYW
jgi:hypothetical protein